MKDFFIKMRVDSNLSADHSNFLANKTVEHVLELYVTNNFIQNNSRQNQITNLFIESCPLFGKVYKEHYISKLLSAMHRYESNRLILKIFKKI